MEVESFPYLPLNVHTHEIRLLVLREESTEREGEDPHLFGTIEHVSLIDTGPYIGLSYCWGEPTPSKLIRLKPYRSLAFQDVTITKNLYSALWAVWKNRKDGMRSMRIWVDAICINQHDAYEKGQQIQRMQQIYSKAWKVAAWAGPCLGTPSQTALEHLSMIPDLSCKIKRALD